MIIKSGDEISTIVQSEKWQNFYLRYAKKNKRSWPNNNHHPKPRRNKMNEKCEEIPTENFSAAKANERTEIMLLQNISQLVNIND